MEEEHELGDCERLWGYTCENCRAEYIDRAMEWEYEEALNAKQELY